MMKTHLLRSLRQIVRRAQDGGIGAIMALAVLAGCAPRRSSIGGLPAAPPKPDSYYRPPAGEIAPASPKVTLPATMPNLATLSLADVVDLSLRNNPTTRISWAQALSAADEYGASRGALLPSVTADVSASRSLALSSPTRPAGERTQYGPSVSLSYMVFDFGGRAGRIDVARKTAVAASLSHNAVVQNTILGTESAVFNLLGTNALRDAQAVVVTEAKTNLAAAQDRHEVGLATIADVLQAQTALSQAQLTLETLEGQVDIARGGVAVAMGLPATTSFDIPDVAASDSVQFISESVDSLIAIAERARPDLASARAQVAAASANVRAANAANRPALLLGTTTGRTESNQIGFAGNTYSLNLGLQLPIFTGFSNEYHAREASDQLIAASARAEQVRQGIALQVLTAYAGLQTSTRRVRTATDLLASAQQSEQVALGRYREGVGSIVDLLIAQSALADARAQSIQTRWQWRQALAQLAHDVGTLGIHGEPTLNPNLNFGK
jgi:outer membrane protein